MPLAPPYPPIQIPGSHLLTYLSLSTRPACFRQATMDQRPSSCRNIVAQPNAWLGQEISRPSCQHYVCPSSSRDDLHSESSLYPSRLHGHRCFRTHLQWWKSRVRGTTYGAIKQNRTSSHLLAFAPGSDPKCYCFWSSTRMYQLPERCLYGHQC